MSMSARDLPVLPESDAAQAPLRRLCAGDGMQANFQPIAALRDGAVFGYEGLIRGPLGSDMYCPLALFAAARKAGVGPAMEIAAARRIIGAFHRMDLPGRLAVNFSASGLEALFARGVSGTLLGTGISPSRLVIELTEHERVSDFGALRSQVARLHSLGVAFALDDFGDGHSTLRLWEEVAPEFVKIDKYFIRGVHADRSRLHCVKALQRLADAFGTRLVAEGIEEEEELRTLRALGVELGQGYLLGPPRPVPARARRFNRAPA